MLAERGLIGQLQGCATMSPIAPRSDLHRHGLHRRPYRRGGNSAGKTGFDCSGLSASSLTQARGLVLPRKASEQAAGHRSH